MDIVYTLVKTFGYILSLGVAAIIPVLFILALLKKLPWALSAPAMALVAFISAYPAGMIKGIEHERAAWHLEVARLRAQLDADKHLAAQKLLAIEKKYLQAQSENARQQQIHNEELDRLLDQGQSTIPFPKESDDNGSKSCPVCRPYRMRVDPRILRNIQKR